MPYLTIMRPRRVLAVPPRTVVLTFDDGPNPRDEITLRLLKVLHTHGVQAHFCVIGQAVAASPQLARRITDAGHQLVNHGYAHRFPLFRGKAAIEEEIDRCDEAIGVALGIAGYHSRYCRPPFGLETATMHQVLHQRGMHLMVGSCYIGDNCYPASFQGSMLAQTLRKLRNDDGGINIWHENSYGAPSWYPPANRPWLADAVATLISTLKDEGFRFALYNG